MVGRCLAVWGKDPQHPAATNLKNFLTVHYRFHILDKTVDNLQCLYCSYLSLLLSESV